MLDVCPHCHQMTYIIMGWKILIHCMKCNMDWTNKPVNKGI